MKQLEVRDFIMVVTVLGEVETLPLHRIEHIHNPGGNQPLAVVVMKGPEPQERRTLVIRENAECFVKRCERLQEALRTRDLAGINHHLAPALSNIP